MAHALQSMPLTRIFSGRSAVTISDGAVIFGCYSVTLAGRRRSRFIKAAPGQEARLAASRRVQAAPPRAARACRNGTPATAWFQGNAHSLDRSLARSEGFARTGRAFHPGNIGDSCSLRPCTTPARPLYASPSSFGRTTWPCRGLRAWLMTFPKSRD